MPVGYHIKVSPSPSPSPVLKDNSDEDYVPSPARASSRRSASKSRRSASKSRRSPSKSRRSVSNTRRSVSNTRRSVSKSRRSVSKARSPTAKRARSRSRSVKITSKRSAKKINGIDIGWYPAGKKFSKQDEEELKRLGGKDIKTDNLRHWVEHHAEKEKMFRIVKKIPEFARAHDYWVVERLVRFFKDFSLNKSNEPASKKSGKNDEVTRNLVLEKFVKGVQKEIKKEIKRTGDLDPREYLDDYFEYNFGSFFKDSTLKEGGKHQFTITGVKIKNNEILDAYLTWWDLNPDTNKLDFRGYEDPTNFNLDFTKEDHKNRFIDLLQAINKAGKNKFIPHHEIQKILGMV